MTEKDYISKLKGALEQYFPISVKNLNRVLENLPEKTKELDIIIFPSQDTDGIFSIQVSLSGPDLYVLNKSIESISDVLDVSNVEEELLPDVPVVDDLDIDYDLNKTLVSIVSEWISDVWEAVNKEDLKLPVTFFAYEDYGLDLPKKLN
ncbi:conserved hypothetical protein [Tenacibaculum sp. 190524A05c]|uniref:DUF6389 family protein n=1 Tax=Tenacibaculum platacis TaxID=3137852 RepID=UPI0031FB6255